MPSKTYTKVFNLFPEGPDSDYGVINSETVKVTVEQSWEWDEDAVKEMKESLAEYFDVRIGMVQTDEDVAAEAKHWEEEGEKMKRLDQDAMDAVKAMKEGKSLRIDRATDRAFLGSIRVDQMLINTMKHHDLIEDGLRGRLSDFYKLTEHAKTLQP